MRSARCRSRASSSTSSPSTFAAKPLTIWCLPASEVGERSAPIFRRVAFDNAADVIGMPGLHPHELRHTAASLAIAAGADVKVVQKMLGHKSATMTLDQYGHLFDDRLDDVADRLDAAADAYVVSNSQPRDNVRPLRT